LQPQVHLEQSNAWHWLLRHDPLLQDPHARVPPHPSLIEPQVAPVSAHVDLVQQAWFRHTWFAPHCTHALPPEPHWVAVFPGSHPNAGSKHPVAQGTHAWAKRTPKAAFVDASFTNCDRATMLRR
jgi:hypothetical protein